MNERNAAYWNRGNAGVRKMSAVNFHLAASSLLRDVSEIRLTQRFVELHKLIWQALRDEVQKAYSLSLS